MYEPQLAPPHPIGQAVIGPDELPSNLSDLMELPQEENAIISFGTDARTVLGQTSVPATIEFSTPPIEDQPDSCELDGTRISEVLTDREVVERVRLFDEKSRNAVIGDLVEFCTIFGDVEPSELQSYMDRLTKTDCFVHPDKYPNGYQYGGEQWKYSALVFTTAKKLGLPDTESKDSQRKLFDFFNTRKHGPKAYYYHGFNAVFEDSISENGLDPNMRTWEWQELEDIQRICGNAGYTRTLGWSDLNCRGKISIADDPRHIYHYAYTSPEWFGQFVAEGSHMNDESVDKTAFYRKDYIAARRNVEIFCDKMTSNSDEDIAQKKSWPNISPDDKQRVLAFFEKYWAKLAKDDYPRVALCRKSSIDQDGTKYRTFDEFIANGFATAHDHSKNGKERPATTDEMIQILCGEGPFSYFRASDKQINHPVSPSDITIIALPKYNDIFPRQQTQNEMQA